MFGKNLSASQKTLWVWLNEKNDFLIMQNTGEEQRREALMQAEPGDSIRKLMRMASRVRLCHFVSNLMNNFNIKCPFTMQAGTNAWSFISQNEWNF